ncbi:PepSY domain-containing protein [Peptostreptococcus faecalis]|uniref:PepSY domain-containing protein n=1 Tax=Peptostreptococcus faecalis TaxID=2045015 RepID=UPI000C7A646D|nr:PepSY domain-containing protein [Peptostreptococcus faecalis]
MISSNNFKKFIKNGTVLSICLILGLSSVGCSNSSSSKNASNKESIESVSDIRNMKFVTQQQAILRLTTSEKASSVYSITLSEVESKYIYSIDGLTKKGEKILMTVDAKSGDVIKKEIKGAASAEEKKNFIDFVPVLDVDKAGSKAISLSKEDYNHILSYTLYANNGKNIYKFTLGNPENSSSKTEDIYIDAVTGNQTDKSAGSDSTSSNKASGDATSNSTTSNSESSNGSTSGNSASENISSN